MAKKKASKDVAKSAGKRAAKKSAPRSRQRTSRKRAKETSSQAGAELMPKEWQRGRIVIGKPPAKPLKGRNAERLRAADVRDADDLPIPRKVCDWFVRKLDPSHKVSVRTDDSYDAPKVAHVSPEAAHLLRKSAAAWARLADAERDDARKREHKSLDSLATSEVPKEFQDGKVVLTKPRAPVTIAYCWKPDFEGEVYQAVLHYYGYLPAEHVGSITDPRGYPARAMSPEAAGLYRDHRSFWEAKHLESKANSKVATAARRQAAEISVEKAATSAGLSRAELEAKLDRLGMLVKEDNLRLVADMIAGFGDAWLYEALLAGSSVAPDGDLKPGKILKRFKERAKLILVLALAAMPDGLSLDPSLRHDSVMLIELDADTVDIVADIATKLPNLKARWGERRNFNAPEFQELRLEIAAFLAARIQGGLMLSVSTIGPDEAAALAKVSGTLELEDLESLPEDIAASLATHAGDLAFPSLTSISQGAAAALETHVGRLTLGDREEFTIDAAVAHHLGRHAGPVRLPGVRQLDPQAASLLAAQKHGLDVGSIEEFPAGPSGVNLCECVAASPGTSLHLCRLSSLSSECASALAAFGGDLKLDVRTWSDPALLAIAQHHGRLEINPEIISDAVGAALSRRGASTALTIADLLPKGPGRNTRTTLTDGAAEALKSYRGELVFAGEMEMSPIAARHLTERDTIVLYRSKIKAGIRNVFESAGIWKDNAWTRRGCSASEITAARPCLTARATRR